MSYEGTRSRNRYRAVMPPEAWKHAHQPRERARRRAAVDDLLEGLDRYLRRKGVDPLLAAIGDGELVRSDYTDKAKLSQWVTWAARIVDPYVRFGLGPAPDGSEWRIVTRWELY